MKKIEKALQIIKRPNLTRGQASLHELICKKVETNEMILFIEAKEIWLSKVCREVRNGVPHAFNFWANRTEKDGKVDFEGAYQPMTEFEITSRVLLWLTSNIGALVLKGYLKVIPMIEIKKLDDN